MHGNKNSTKGNAKVKPFQQTSLLDLFSKSPQALPSVARNGGSTESKKDTRKRRKSQASDVEAFEGEILPPVSNDDTDELDLTSISIEEKDPAFRNHSVEVISPKASGHSHSTRPIEGSSRDMPIVLTESPQKNVSESAKLWAVDSAASAPKLLHPLFSRVKALPKASTSATPVSRRNTSSTLISPATLPDSTNQHVRGEQTSLRARALPPGFSPHSKPIDGLNEDLRSMGLNNILNRDSESLPTSFGRSSITSLSDDELKQARQHPAITRFNHRLASSCWEPSTNAQELWTEKWRPRRADQVLGNSKCTFYLLEWLSALKLQAPLHPSSVAPEELPKDLSRKKRKGGTKDSISRMSKRPRVTRAVKKSRKKRVDSDEEDDNDSWIVPDDDMDEDATTLYSSEAEDTVNPVESSRITSTPLPRPAEPTYQPLVFTELTNTILLCGPPGCGKTAAVYACAEEQGWEVFEVYPGIGKRAGASLNDLVGEVGKNHIVGHGQARGDDTNRGPAKRPPNIFDRRRTTPAADVEVTPKILEPGNESTNSAATAVVQSLILLEEVDILFKEDAGFWPSVISLIRDSKRPVVLTCNDYSLVPLEHLPLQEILHFEPCPTPLAAAYLERLCSEEGYTVGIRELVELYERPYDTFTLDIANEPLNPLATPFLFRDLRRTIHQLQFLCANKPERYRDEDPGWIRTEDLADWSSGSMLRERLSNVPVEQQCRTLRTLAMHMDTVSFADSSLVRPVKDQPEALRAMYDHGPSPDDEAGHAILYDTGLLLHAGDDDDNDDGPGSAFEILPAGSRQFYHEDAVIFEAGLRLSRGIIEPGESLKPAHRTFSARALFDARISHQAQLLRVFGGDSRYIPLSAPLMPRPGFFLDYEAWIRNMLAVDDTLHKLSTEAGAENQTGSSSSQRLTRRLTRNSNRDRYIRQMYFTEAERSLLDNTRLD